MRHRLDRTVELLDEGRVLLGGDPTTILRLSAAGARRVADWRDGGGEIHEATSAGESTLIERLLARGMAHPAPDLVGVADLVVVVPVRDRPEALERCLAALVASAPSRIVVVDDGSADAASHRRIADAQGAELVRRERSGGPAAARMAGWDHLRADGEGPEFVAFVDSDVVVEPEWSSALLGHFDAPDVGLVAPRVRHDAGPGLIDRYEAVNSPLDLGHDPAPIVAGTRVSYVPAAALVVRSSAFADVGGFDTSLDVGEDVDLLWRLADAGWRCRYEPSDAVDHLGRPTLGAVLRRRFDYGRSAAALDARHPGSLPPLRGSPWSAAVLALAAAGHPVAATGVAGWTVAAMARKLGTVPGGQRLAARLVLRGHLGFARQVARAIVRPWLPITFVLCLASRRARRLALVAALTGPTITWREREPDMSLPTWVALSLADDVSYTAGVWWSCWSAREWGALTPDVRPAKTQN